MKTFCSVARKIQFGKGGLLFCLVSFAFLASAETMESEREDDPSIESVTIVATKEDDLNRTPGAAHSLDREQLDEFEYDDIQRMLWSVPGVSLQVEDGYGLRPNISIRGVATERSGRITLLEDNVLIAPAPYSAPSAYYFPTAGRMYSLEVLKGPAAISQGPYTVGGALNMVSTPIPTATQGRLIAQIGQNNSRRVHAWYGATLEENTSVLVETHQWFSEGFQSIDNANDKSGLSIQDYTFKLRVRPFDGPHQFDLKLQYADQDSDQSYLGLTDEDFGTDPYRRYGVSALDHIATDHDQAIFSYSFDISERTSFRAIAYRNIHARTWFKTEGIDFDGSDSAESLSRTSWSSVISSINSGSDRGGFSPSELAGILNGSVDTPAGSIQVRSNARTYFSKGTQLWLQHGFELGGSTHELQISVRKHADEEDRLQRNSAYSQVGGQLQLDDLGLLGNAGNRLQEADALAIYIDDTIDFGRLAITPGLRYEFIDQMRTRWEIRSGRTTDPSDRSDGNLRSTRQNKTKVLSPGIGFSYGANDELIVFGGAHKGFTAPSNSPGVDEESAWVYEGGLRYASNESSLTLDLVGFLTDYNNILGECTASSGVDCEVGDAFNGDAATVQGLEAQLNMDLHSSAAFSLPLRVNVTLIDAQFDTDIADTDFFGDVSAGDPIPYIPEFQLNIGAGVVQDKRSVYLNVISVGDVCVRSSCGQYEQVDGFLTLDLSGSYQFSDRLDFFGRIDNLLGDESMASRHPYGARPHRPRTLSIGIRAQL